jgi:CheY-like chemotaxis protein
MAYCMSMQAHSINPSWIQPSLKPSSRILVADDDVMHVRLLKDNLESMGHQVRCVYDGQMALKVALSESFDLIIMDIKMPMTSGYRVLQFLRVNPATARVPVIFVTGEMASVVYPMVERSPRTAYMSKPLDLESLNSLVNNFLERYPVA